MAEDKPTITKEELEALNKDIDVAKSSIVSKETQEVIQKAKDDARVEAEKEFELKKQLDEQKQEADRLKAQLADNEKKAADQLEAMKTKVDAAIESQAVVQSQNPFNPHESQQSSTETVEQMSDEQVNNIEYESAKEFFGESYRSIMRDN